MNYRNALKVKAVLRNALTVLAVLVPTGVWACPLCVNATPYKDGLLIAVGFLMVVPFVLVYFMFGWIRRASHTEN